RNGLGTPLIRRALSMRKRGPKESRRSDSFNQFAFAAYSASTPPPPLPDHQTNASKLSRLQRGQKQQDQGRKQDSPLSDNYDMVSVEDDSPLRLSHAIKRSKSALAIKQTDDEASRFTAESKEAGSPSLFSLQSSIAQLDLNTEMQAALAEGISLYGLDGLSIKDSVVDDGGKKDEWISNIQYLRQRLADHNISVGDVTANSGGTVGGKSNGGTRKRRSSSSDMRLATNAMLHGDTLSSAMAAAAGKSVLRDYPRESGSGDPVPTGVQQQLQQTNNAKHGSAEDADMLAGLDVFAPVTFDAGKLFRQSILAGSEKSPSSPFCPDSARSPAEYMATFSDVRRKYSSPKALETSAAGKAGSDQAGGHWFLSKVKSALTGNGSNSGGRHGGNSHYGSNGNIRQQPATSGRHRNGSTKNSDGSDTARSASDGLLPRLDVDLGTTSLLTPDSMHRVPQQEDYTLVSHDMSPFPKLQGDPASGGGGSGAAASNDSAYYLIDYINGQHEDNDDKQQQYKHPDIRAARRVVNKSTRMRQTQYEYNFGSQIFECLDKDLLLLKTDAFKDFEKEVGRRVDSYGIGGAAAAAGAASTGRSFARKRQQQGSKADPETAHSVARRSRKKPTDVTGATAYTAAAINSIVAHNAKARSTKMSASAVPSITDINANNLGWQLTT
ncbi:hypothetical protein LPJ59_005875, partial [Coemansia sp. RSA 2399]